MYTHNVYTHLLPETVLKNRLKFVTTSIESTLIETQISLVHSLSDFRISKLLVIGPFFPR